MTRKPRERSEADFYHIVTRGVGHQIIFEDNQDRSFYLSCLRQVLDEYQGQLLCWCLLDNHVHLLLHVDYGNLADFMRLLNSRYALYFNKRHERDGYLIDRFKSEPINSESHLLSVVRYIHQNPQRAGIDSTENYYWSSYHEYLRQAKIIRPDFVLSLFGSAEDFRHFHTIVETEELLDETPTRRGRVDDDIAKEVACKAIHPVQLNQISSLPRKQRDALLASLKKASLSCRQIERLTGISRSVVTKA